jgi:hypothetical protein
MNLSAVMTKMSPEGVLKMARYAGIACDYFSVAKENKTSISITDELVGAINNNFATFKEWSGPPKDHHKCSSILESYISNYSTLIKW